MGIQLTRVKLSGYKTIYDLGESGLALRSLNILIGANGAGKSNFISFFRMLSWSLSSATGNLQLYISQQGGASKLLHDGPTLTREIAAEITIASQQGANNYAFRLVYAGGDTLIYADEKYRYTQYSQPSLANWRELGAGHREAQLLIDSEDVSTTREILNFIRQCKIFQFHNTSATSRMREKWRDSEGRWLKEDAGNIAPFLYRLSEDEPVYYRRIVETLQLILPFFDDFVLTPEYNNILLQWREIGSDIIFDASQASDGMLRAIALVALLGQPEKDLPEIIILDEPELGLHPYAITIVAGLLKTAARQAQVIIATQSAPFVDEFRPEDIIVVDRKNRKSSFSRLDETQLEGWLEEYTISELWKKNVLGGRPSR